jgi:hypothetical protein
MMVSLSLEEYSRAIQWSSIEISRKQETKTVVILLNEIMQDNLKRSLGNNFSPSNPVGFPLKVLVLFLVSFYF